MSSPHNAVDDAEQMAVLESLHYPEPPSQDRYAHTNSRSAGKTLIVFSIVLAPFVVAPYFLLRRRFSGLVREFEALRNANGSLVREVRASTAEFARERGILTSGVLNRLNELRQAQDSYRATVDQAGADRTREVVEAVREAQRSAGENAARLAGILEVAAEARRQNYLDDKRWQTETSESIQGLQGQVNRSMASTMGPNEMKDLARALADVAAFIHEVEMREGLVPRPGDGRGVERMRELGQKLEAIASSAATSGSPATKDTTYH